jgi:hypothetical protein
MKVNKPILLIGSVLVILFFVIFIFLDYLSANVEQGWKSEPGQNQTKWDSQHISHYRMSVFLPYDSGYYSSLPMPLTVEVKNGNVISMIDARGNIVLFNGDTNAGHYYDNYFTVPGLFATVLESYSKKPASIVVSYDLVLGYPARIYVDPYKEPCCQDYEILVQDFQILPP